MYNEQEQNDEIIQHDLSVSTLTVIFHSIWMTILLMLVPLIPYSYIWGKDDLVSTFFNPHIILPALILIVCHELLHAIGWKMSSELQWNDFKFGIIWKTLSPYCHSKRAMPLKSYRIGSMLPGLLLGILPIILGTIFGNSMLAILGGILTAGASGDIYVLWLLRNVKSTAMIIDHPSKVGCIVLYNRSDKQ